MLAKSVINILVLEFHICGGFQDLWKCGVGK